MGAFLGQGERRGKPTPAAKAPNAQDRTPGRGPGYTRGALHAPAHSRTSDLAYALIPSVVQRERARPPTASPSCASGTGPARPRPAACRTSRRVHTAAARVAPGEAAPAQARRKRHADNGGGGARPAQAPARERRSKPVADNLAAKLAASSSMEGARTALELAYGVPGAVPLRCLFDCLFDLAPAATAAAAVAAAHRSGRLGELVSAQASFEDGAQRIYNAYTAMADERRKRAQRATMASHTLRLDVVTSSSKGLL